MRATTTIIFYKTAFFKKVNCLKENEFFNRYIYMRPSIFLFLLSLLERKKVRLYLFRIELTGETNELRIFIPIINKRLRSIVLITKEVRNKNDAIMMSFSDTLIRFFLSFVLFSGTHVLKLTRSRASTTPSTH